MRRLRFAALAAALVLAGAPARGAEERAAPKGERRPNGFSLAGARVPPQEILEGGPPRDQIRSVDAPVFASPEEATWVTPTTPVLGVEIDGVGRAYPVHLLEFHQIVNDEIAGVPIAVTYDPLAGAPLVYRRSAGGRTLGFGVSGLVWSCNFLLYDRETQSLWSQFTGEALAGPLAGTRLVRVPVRQEPLARWLARAPASRVLARPAPTEIDYRYSPYSSYWVQDGFPFPVAATDRRFHAKELVLGVRVGTTTRAYLGSLATRAGGRVEDRVEGKPVRFVYTSELGSFDWEAPDGVEVTESFWFAWKAFHPDTQIWNEPKDGEGTGDPER